MLLSLPKMINKYSLHIRGVLHIGAHWGQEYKAYAEAGVENMLFFEPVAASYQRLCEGLPKQENVRALKLALGNSTGEMEMYVETENKGMSSSLLQPHLHLKQYPHITFREREIVTVDKLDNVDFSRENFNMINIDVQGYELEVFRGATHTLPYIDVIYTEVNFQELYRGCCLVEELDAFLKQFGFYRILTDYSNRTWGDALYINYYEKNDRKI